MRLPERQDLARLQAVGNTANPEQACLAIALSARLLAVEAKIDQGLRLLDTGRAKFHAHAHLGLLDWAEADILLNNGQLGPSSKAFARAQQHFSTEAQWANLARLCLHRAEQMLVRCELEEAAVLTGNARNHAQKAREPELGIFALRCASEIALFRGFQAEAEGLFLRMEQEVEPLDDPTPIHQAIRLGQCTLALLRGQLSEADAALSDLRQHDGNLLEQVAWGRREGEIRLRQGRHTDAIAALQRGQPILKALGMRAASAAQLGTIADVQAAGGNPMAAAKQYREALSLACIAGDFHSAKRCCQHLAAMERCAKSSPFLPLLHAMLVDLDAITAPPIDLTR
jgi:predicted negative regulator of RcsB-dependent stress response